LISPEPPTKGDVSALNGAGGIRLGGKWVVVADDERIPSVRGGTIRAGKTKRMTHSCKGVKKGLRESKSKKDVNVKRGIPINELKVIR